MTDIDSSHQPVGYRNPPVSGRFVAGRSGNPNGRPKGSKMKLPYEAVLGRKLAIAESGVQRQVTAAEAMLLHIAKQGLKGEMHEAKEALKAIETARERQPPVSDGGFGEIRVVYVDPGNPNRALYLLQMAQKVDPLLPSCVTLLQPWLVQASLARLDDKRFNLAEQQQIVAATLTPAKVNWPDWWEAACDTGLPGK